MGPLTHTLFTRAWVYHARRANLLVLTFSWSLAQRKHSTSLCNARLVYLLLVLLNTSTSSSLLNARLIPLLTCRHTMHGDTFLVGWTNHARLYLASRLDEPCTTVPC